MVVLKPFPYLRSSEFSWNAETKKFSAFASDLKGFGRLGRVYDDACDEGFTMISDRTGREVVFVSAGTEHDREGDVQAWVFVPAVGQRDRPDCLVVIFND